MASPQFPTGSFDEDHDPPIYRALNPTEGHTTAPRAPVLCTNTMDDPPTSEQATAPTPLAPPNGHETPSTAAAQDERATDTLPSHQPAEDKMAPSPHPPPPATHKPTGQSGVPKSLYYDLAVASVQSPSDAPATIGQVKGMIQDSIREAMGHRCLGETPWDSLIGPNGLPSPSHRPTPPCSPVERHPSLGKLPGSFEGSEALPNRSMHDSIPVRAPFSASNTMDEPCGPKPVDDNTASYPLQTLERALEKVLAAKGVTREEGKGVGEGEPGGSKATPASILEYKHVDEVWDDKAGKYRLVDPADSRGDELDQYIFVVRDRIDRITQKTTTFVDIKCARLRDILREVCKDTRGVSLASSKPSIERSNLFYVRKDLKLRFESTGHSEDASMGSRPFADVFEPTPDRAENAAMGSRPFASQFESIENATMRKHLSLLVDYVHTTFQPIAEQLATLLAKGEITYDLLWALFEPNAEVYTTCPGTGAPRCVLLNYCEERKKMDGSRYMHLDTRYLNTDGKVLGEVTTGLEIPHFRGTKQIEHLQAYPLQYHPEKDRVRRDLIQYGRTFVSLIGIHHRSYKGKAFFIDIDSDNDDIVARHIEGRIMVDTICFHERMPNYPCARVQKVRPRYSASGRCDSIKLADIIPGEAGETEFLICSPTVLGFCLSNKQFLEFAVGNINDIEWSPSSFDDVKIPETQKKPIWALTDTYLKREPGDGFADLVQGKGRGVNFLLYGPPGVGKTLTAETIAETFRIPLYTVPAGQIGVDPVKVESVLTSIFKIASRWKAILLLDEADVFLAQRSDNPQLNALVSVFLRELEQYDGILFLTTNRMQAFDEAMISRIHLALSYKPLGQDARKAVWEFFLKQAATKKGNAKVDKGVIDDLAEKNLNGREIRNAVLVARSMAEYDDAVVSGTHLDDSIAAKEQFRYDFRGAGAVENLGSYA